jgi:mRNA interferase HigB
MRVLAKRTLREFWESKPQYADSESPLSAWYTVCANAAWRSPSDVKASFRSASFIKNNVVSNIAVNKYRVVVNISYSRQAMFIKFVGTHRQYDEVDVGDL